MLRLWRSRRGLAGIEFALVLPLLLSMLFGVVDLSAGIITSRRLAVAADAVATIASTMAVQATNLNILLGTQAWQATTAPFAIFPQWRGVAGPASFAITLSSVNFTATPAGCTTACSYTAKTAWSAANPNGQTNLRPCGMLSSVPNSSPSTLASLPAGVFGATSVLVGDVAAVYVPMFTGVFVGNVTMLRSAYVSPRVNNGVQLAAGFPGNSVTCP